MFKCNLLVCKEYGAFSCWTKLHSGSRKSCIKYVKKKKLKEWCIISAETGAVLYDNDHSDGLLV